MELTTHKGGCHCKAVQYEVLAPRNLEAHECNCSKCHMGGFMHVIVPKSRFKLLQGNEALCTYTFNTHTAKHKFCRVCGVESFYIPRSNPDGFSVNARCLDMGSVESLKIVPFDGQNWEANAKKVAHLSKE